MSEFTFHTLRESITSAIREKILTGGLQPGCKLTEQKLAEEFGSSRAPIREALRQLEQEGLIEYSRNVGCSVKKITIEDAYEIYLLRANLEMTALRQFDCQFPAEDLAAMRGLLDEMLQVPSGDLLAIVENDNRFHRIIVQRAGLPRLLKFWDDLELRQSHCRGEKRPLPRRSGGAAERDPHRALPCPCLPRHRGRLSGRLRPLHEAAGSTP